VVIGKVMVDDQNIDAPVSRMSDGAIAGCAAVECDDERRPGIYELIHGRNVWAVAFKNAIGDMHLRLNPEMPQVARHQCAGGWPVYVIVAKESDRLIVGDSLGDTLGQG